MKRKNNYTYGRKIQKDHRLRLPPWGRLDQGCNGDLEATNARRRKHLIGTIAHCWQLRKICEDEKQWLRQRITALPKVIKPKKTEATTPRQMYNEMAKALVGVFFLCLCGDYQKKYDAAHVFANHMAKLVYLTTADNKPLFQVILNMICTGNTGRNFVFTHHLCNCINFESKHSSQSLREQAS